MISKTGEKRYSTRVREPEAGLEAHGDFVPPSREDSQWSAHDGEVAWRDLKSSRPQAGDDARTTGTSLFRAVFTEEILVSWKLRLLQAKTNGTPLRLRLHLNSPDLWDLPWERLHDPKQGFLALAPETPVVRYVERMEPFRPLRVRPPIRVLVVSACPAGLSPLSVHEEHEHLEGSLDEMRDMDDVEVDRLERATRDALRRKLQEKSFHILHFIGHGTFDAEQGGGAILLEGQDGRPDRLSEQELSVLLAAHPQLRLVVLNACDSARGDRVDPFAGLMQSLIQRGLPAVVAMSSAVPDRAAILFSRYFYEALARREPVDAAVGKGRNAMFNQATSEWASPVLAMRTPGGKIFDFTRWEILFNALTKIGECRKYWLATFLLLALLGIGFWELGKRWLDPNLLFAFFNPPECPSPPGLSIAFVKIEPPRSQPFCMGRFEVTQRLWKRIEGKIRSRRHGDALPVVRVSWYDANRFLEKLEKRDPGGRFRLPAAAEWQYAAGNGTSLKASDETANCENEEANDGYEAAAPVGSFPPNAAGVCDMAGNVSEWGSDSDGPKRPVRGGSFQNVLRNCSVRYWTGLKPDSRYDDTGFRIVRGLKVLQ